MRYALLQAFLVAFGAYPYRYFPSSFYYDAWHLCQPKGFIVSTFKIQLIIIPCYFADFAQAFLHR